MKLGIQKKIILIAITIVFFTVGINTLINGIYFSREYSSVRQSEAFAITQTLKSQLDRLLQMHIPINELAGFEEICKDLITEHPFLSYAMIITPDGRILFHNDPQNNGEVISDAMTLEAVIKNEKTVQVHSVNSERYYDVFLPVHGSHGEFIAVIRTGYSKSIIATKVEKLIYHSIAVTFFLLVLGSVMLVILLHFWVGKPIHKFIDEINIIKESWTEPTRRVEIKSHDEIGQLAAAFNEMTDDLRTTTVSKDYMNNIIENMLNCLIITDQEFNIKSVNQETLHLLGYSEEEIVGEPIFKVLSGRGIFMPELEESSESSKAFKSIETTYIAQNGDEIPVLFSSSILRRETGELDGFICVAQDITEIKILRGFIPICASCKNIRDDQGYWNKIESYISRHSGAEFSHSICPACTEKLYPHLNKKNKEKGRSSL